jgi:putative flippase GtrA
MYLLDLGAVTSNIIGYLCGLVTSYLLNKFFTFKSASKSKAELARFVAVFLLSYAANILVLLFCIDIAKIHEAIAQVVAGMFYVATSFMLNKFYVFREQYKA